MFVFHRSALAVLLPLALLAAVVLWSSRSAAEPAVEPAIAAVSQPEESQPAVARRGEDAQTVAANLPSR